jgi:hypothetical protein
VWDKTEINIGNILEGSTPEVEFRYKGDLAINDIVVSCGCLTPVFDKETGILKVKFKSGKVPVHLRYKGEMVVNKTVNIYGKKIPKTTLTISATVQMKYKYGKIN